MSLPGDYVKKPKRWTDERVRIVASMWANGESAGNVAAALNEAQSHGGERFTRNAVLGYIHRNGLNGGARAAKPRERQPRAPRPSRAKVRRSPAKRPKFNIKGTYTPKPPRAPVVLPVPENAVSMAELPHWGCRWPVNEAPVGGTHLFCGTKREAGEPYCLYHLDKARNDRA